MNDAQALEIVSALASGMDPDRDAPVEAPSILLNANVIRALYVAVRALEATTRSKARRDRANSPTNKGKPWTEAEEYKLLEGFDAGQSVAQLAQAHSRTPAGIQARLERHGRVQGQGLQWRGRAAAEAADGVSGADPKT